MIESLEKDQKLEKELYHLCALLILVNKRSSIKDTDTESIQYLKKSD